MASDYKYVILHYTIAHPTFFSKHSEMCIILVKLDRRRGQIFLEIVGGRLNFFYITARYSKKYLKYACLHSSEIIRNDVATSWWLAEEDNEPRQ